MTCNNCQCKSNNEEIEDFDEDKEYSVGEFFKMGNEVFKVIEGTDSLYLHSRDCMICDLPYEIIKCRFRCSRYERKDRIGVTAILYDTIEENE